MSHQAYPYPDEPTMDERYLETIHEVESLYSRRSSVAATALPELPLYALLCPLLPNVSLTTIAQPGGASYGSARIGLLTGIYR
jgi:hypothetical protein